MSTKEETAAKPETTTVIILRSLAAMVRTIADHRDITMPEALERYARPGLTREYRKVLDEMHKTLGDNGA